MKKIKGSDLKKCSYFQLPKWLMKLFLKGDLSLRAFKMYILMYDRAKLSAKNDWVDEEGYVFIKYKYTEFLEDLMGTSKSTIANGLKELENIELLEKKRNYNNGNIYYLGIKDSQDDNEEKIGIKENEIRRKKNKKKSTVDGTYKCTNNSTEKKNTKGTHRCTNGSTRTCTNDSTHRVYPNNNINNNNNILKTTKSNKEISSSFDIVGFLLDNDIEYYTMKNILNLDNLDYKKVVEVVEYGKKKNWGDGAIYLALRDNWILDIEPEVSSEEIKKKRSWLNYFAGIDKITKEELLEAIKFVPMEELIKNKSELCRMNVDIFKNYLIRLGKKYRNKMGG